MQAYAAMRTRKTTVARFAVLSLGLLLAAVIAQAQVSLIQISTDPFTNPTSQHATLVEPDTFSFGSTVVAAFQSGRFFDGGASDIGFATTMDGGATWTSDFLPGITTIEGSGPFDRVSDPSVAYDANHGVWLIASLALLAQGANTCLWLHTQAFATCTCRSHHYKSTHSALFRRLHPTISNFRGRTLLIWTAQGIQETSQQDLHRINRNSSH